MSTKHTTPSLITDYFFSVLTAATLILSPSGWTQVQQPPENPSECYEVPSSANYTWRSNDVLPPQNPALRERLNQSSTFPETTSLDQVAHRLGAQLNQLNPSQNPSEFLRSSFQGIYQGHAVVRISVDAPFSMALVGIGPQWTAAYRLITCRPEGNTNKKRLLFIRTETVWLIDILPEYIWVDLLPGEPIQVQSSWTTSPSTPEIFNTETMINNSGRWRTQLLRAFVEVFQSINGIADWIQSGPNHRTRSRLSTSGPAIHDPLAIRALPEGVSLAHADQLNRHPRDVSITLPLVTTAIAHSQNPSTCMDLGPRTRETEANFMAGTGDVFGFYTERNPGTTYAIDSSNHDTANLGHLYVNEAQRIINDQNLQLQVLRTFLQRVQTDYSNLGIQVRLDSPRVSLQPTGIATIESNYEAAPTRWDSALAMFGQSIQGHFQAPFQSCSVPPEAPLRQGGLVCSGERFVFDLRGSALDTSFGISAWAIDYCHLTEEEESFRPGEYHLRISWRYSRTPPSYVLTNIRDIAVIIGNAFECAMRSVLGAHFIGLDRFGHATPPHRGTTTPRGTPQN